MSEGGGGGGGGNNQSTSAKSGARCLWYNFHLLKEVYSYNTKDSLGPWEQCVQQNSLNRSAPLIIIKIGFLIGNVQQLVCTFFTVEASANLDIITETSIDETVSQQR